MSKWLAAESTFVILCLACGTAFLAWVLWTAVRALADLFAAWLDERRRHIAHERLTRYDIIAFRTPRKRF